MTGEADPGKAVRQMEMHRIITEAGLAIEDVLSARNFIYLGTGHEPSFAEALDLCLEIKARYPLHSPSEAFEAGAVAIETGFHERPDTADLPDFAERIFDRIKDRNA